MITEILHNEGIEIIIYQAFAIQTRAFSPIKRRRIIAKLHDQLVRFFGLVNRLGFTAIQWLSFVWHHTPHQLELAASFCWIILPGGKIDTLGFPRGSVKK